MSESRTETPIIFAPETYQYDKSTLDVEDVSSNPIDQFTKWFQEASETEKIPEAVNFATARLPSGRVSSRTVLFKELDQTGFVIYSNWGTSKKSLDIKSNQFASLNFFWTNLQRQVRVEGITEFVEREVSERYFKTRPRGSKIGAWSSPQSTVIKNREELDQITSENEGKFKKLADDEIPCPEFWGGLRVVPLEIEFWQGRPSRLHDRVVFRRESINDNWEIVRIAP